MQQQISIAHAVDVLGANPREHRSRLPVHSSQGKARQTRDSVTQIRTFCGNCVFGFGATFAMVYAHRGKEPELMHTEGKRPLQIGDRVELINSTICASGVITEVLGPDYVRVKWGGSPGSTTHRRHSLELDRQADATERMIGA
ncbi:MAG: hypothetical protein ABSC32_17950 [Steroidobacteraceae bacterium]|jgi:hypothetical protein